MFFGKKRLSSGRSFSLADASREVRRIAEAEALPLAHIAQGAADGPELWFAASIIDVAKVEGVHRNEAEHRAIDRKELAGHELDKQISAIYPPGMAAPALTDLRVSRRELKRYLRWLRTVA